MNGLEKLNFRNRLQNAPPFVQSVETTQTRRVYTFLSANTGKEFQIEVKLPHENYGEAFFQVYGKNLEAELLVSAINFVSHNELRFSEVLDLEGVRKPFEIAEDKNK